MLASLAFPYTLDTGETITEGMGMECLTGDHTPKTDPRHNLVVTAPPYKTRGSTTIGRGGQFPYKHTARSCPRFLHSLSPSYSRLDRIIMNMKHHEGKGKSDFYLDLCIEARVARDLHRDCSGLILGGLGGGGGRGGGG